jgi:hypothetical protein
MHVKVKFCLTCKLEEIAVVLVILKLVALLAKGTLGK